MSTDAQIHDLGYRAYEGERSGVGGAMAALGVHAAQRVMGIKRSARHKVLPIAVLVIAFVPALVYVALAVILPFDDFADLVPTYGDYYGIIGVVIFLFVSFVAPEALCTDRRTGMMALYLASPLNRTTYVLAKVGAVAGILLAITLLPNIFLLVAYSLADIGPDFPVEWFETLGRILVAGVVVGLYFAALSTAVSSLTPRRTVASAALLAVLIAPISVVNGVVESTDISDNLGLLSIAELPFRSAQYLLGEPGTSDPGISQVQGSLVLLVTLGLTAAMGLFTWWRYQVMEVER